MIQEEKLSYNGQQFTVIIDHEKYSYQRSEHPKALLGLQTITAMELYFHTVKLYS